jgi:hypothetical protein
LKADQAIIETGHTFGNQHPRSFTFIAIGPPGNQPFTKSIGLFHGSVSASGEYFTGAAGAFGKVSVQNAVYNIHLSQLTIKNNM